MLLELCGSVWRRSRADVYDEPSWGATLQSYSNSRTQIPWDPAELRPINQVQKNNQNHPSSRVFNPILMKYNDPEKERKLSSAEHDFNVNRLNVAKDRQMCYEQKYNIVSHKSYMRQTARTARQEQSLPDSRVPYNIVSHFPKEAHVNQSIGVVPPEVTARPFEGQVESARPDPSGRPYDILTNKYVEDHAIKERQDKMQARSEAESKFWKTHDYDPVQGRYLLPSKETEYQRQRAALEDVHGAGQLARLPPSVQYSEGAGFNIITQDIKDKMKVEAMEGAGNRRFNNKKGPMIEAEFRRRSETKQDLEAERAMERIGRTGVAKAREDGRHHGFDVVTNEHHHGRGGKTLAPSRLRPPESVLAKLQGDTLSGIGQNPMGTSVASFALSSAGGGGHAAGTRVATGGGGGPGGQPRDLSGFSPGATLLGATGKAAESRADGPQPTPGRQAPQVSSARPVATASARTTARSSARASARGSQLPSSARARVGGGRTNASARAPAPPAVPSLKMPSNITALQNNYE